MDRNREARRSGMVAATSNGLSRRRHRSNSLRDSPDEERGVEIQESVRLRERVKKDRERDRDRDRRSKRRRGDRLMVVGEDSSEESVNDEEDDDDEETTTNNNNVGVVTASNNNNNTRLLPPNPMVAASMVSISNHHHHHSNTNHHNNNHHVHPRKSFPPNTGGGGGGKVLKTTAAPVWKPGDEMIGVSVPRKARSASTKRSHDWISGTSGGGVTGDQIHQSPVRQNIPATSPSPAAPLSPSSSNVSVRKKIKPSGQKRPPAKSPPPKASSSNPEELEIEIAEVLYGLMTQSQGLSKKESGPNDSTTREVNNNRSRVSSPVSNSNSSATPLSAVAPKRKRPRQVLENPGGFGVVRSSPISAKVEMDSQTTKMEVTSPNLEKTPQSVAQNSLSLYDLSASVQSLPPASDPASELMKVESQAKRRPEDIESKEEVSSPKRESSTVGKEKSNIEEAVVAVAQVSEVENQREEKFQIDLMAPPPQLRSSPEREAEMDFGSAAVDNKPIIAENIVEMKPARKEKDDERIGKGEKEERVSVEAEEKKTKAAVEEINSHKTSESSRGRNINLDLDLEKPEKDSGVGSKFQQQQSQKLQLQHQPPLPQKATKEELILEKTGPSSSLPMPMSMATWPGGLPPMGYMAPLQGVVTMDGSTVSSAAPMQPLFSQPRPKRCATHCYIARNIHCLQQFMKMHPFWPPATGSAPFFGAKTNLNVMPSADLHGNLAGRGASGGPDKGQGLTILPSNGGKDKVQPANVADTAQRKQQILLQQALPPVAPNNLLHGPAFIFPINQQQAAAAVRPGPARPPSATAPAGSSNTSNLADGSASTTVGGAATAITFNYPNMSPNEAQYLAILQNNPYAFPIPTVGGPPNYRGTHPQPMPLFNGSFYSSQMIHPSQVQQQHQQQQQQQPPTSQSQQMQQGQQNTSMSSGSSSSQKHLQNQQQQRSQGNAVNGGSGGGNMHNFPGTKNHPSQSPAHSQNQHMPPQTRHIENEAGREDSPSTTERKRSHGPMNVYNQNFAMPMHPSNFGLMTPPANFGVPSSAGGGSNHQTEKKTQQQQQQPGLKTSLESVPPQPFAMSFASFDGATAGPGIGMSMAQNHAIFQSLPEATRQNLQMAAAAAAQAVQQQKNFRISEDSKSGSSDQSGADAERKGLTMKPSGNAGQSIAFSRSDMSDTSGSNIAANSVIDSSSRSLNLPSGASWNARAAMPNAMGAVNVPNAQLQAQIQHQQQQQQQQQQLIQLHKQQQQQQQMAAAVAARSKTSASSNGNAYSEHLTSSASAASKFPNAMSAFPQNLVQSGTNSSQAQSPQWKSSTRTSTSQAPPSLSSNSSLKNLSQQQQQQIRSQQSHTQISFGTNQKSTPPQVQQPPNNNQSPSSPMMVGSPTTSSISKGASGSPRHTNSASTSNKTGQNSSLSTQQGKSSSSVPNQKSSPAGGRNVPSILGNPHNASTSGGATKSQMQQQQQQQQQHLQKTMHQTQLFFSSPYVQAQPPHSTGTSSTGQATGGYFLQRRRPDHPGHQPPGSSGASSSSGMLTLCPVTLGGGTTSDPAKAIAAAAAAANNVKGGVLPSQGILHTAQYTTQTSGSQHQLLPAGFSYVHPVPAAVQVKTAEQKQPAA